MPLDTDAAVRARYSASATSAQPELCCAVAFDPKLLAVIPREVVERDYGCGDPTVHVAPGETVLDLGSGSGKACFIVSQVVGPEGRVIGVDVNPDMLALARRYQGEVGDRIGWHNVSFRHGKIEDLALDLDLLGRWLADHPVTAPEHVAALEAESHRLRAEAPLVADGSVDVVISNCVLNLVGDGRKSRLFREIHRVLRLGGRAVISDIVADEPVPQHLKDDPAMWSGCISGAMTEAGFLAAFEAAGFQGIELLDRGERPWRTVEGIEFRSVTVRAYRGDDGPRLDSNKAVIYRGPWKSVTDDDGRVLRRGRREAVCERTFAFLTGGPHARDLLPVLPNAPLPESEWPPFDGARRRARSPRETKGEGAGAATDPGDNGACSGGGCC